jgi:hypothetical protein
MIDIRLPSLFENRVLARHAAIAILCAAAALGTAALLSLRSTWPEFLPGTYAYEGNASVQFTPPLYLATESPTLRASFLLQLNELHISRFALTPDDCLASLTVNDAPVPMDEKICLDQHGVVVNLAPYLRPGINLISMEIEDYGGYGGFSFAPSLQDPLAVFCLSLLSFAAFLVLLSLLLFFRARPAVYLLSGVLLGGLILRLFLSPHVGYSFDVGVNQGWAKSAALLGFASSYTEQVDGSMLPNYPPLSMHIFGTAGTVYRWAYIPGFDRFDPEFRTVIKLPGKIADLLTALLLFFVLARFRSRIAGVVGAEFYAFHPAVW